MPEPADVSVTIIWPSMVNRSPSRRPETHPHRQMRSSLDYDRVAMMSRMRGQSGRSRESEDSKTDKNAFGHGQLL
jgi:hypothetical protein